MVRLKYLYEMATLVNTSAIAIVPPEASLHERREALAEFKTHSNRAGALLLQGVDLGPTPATPLQHDPTRSWGAAELALVEVASELGHAIGYEPELGGALVQDLFPIRGNERRQVSTSSSTTLAWHTETAFHPDCPHYLLLSCRRGEPGAYTLLASSHDAVEQLDREALQILAQPRFHTRPDESFLAPGSVGAFGPEMAVINAMGGSWKFTYDQQLMEGLDPEAEQALQQLQRAIDQVTQRIELVAGDLLVIDNHVAVHGRSPFTARFDGTDRWLQRTFVVDDLASITGEVVDNIITTRF